MLLNSKELSATQSENTISIRSVDLVLFLFFQIFYVIIVTVSHLSPITVIQKLRNETATLAAFVQRILLSATKFWGNIDSHFVQFQLSCRFQYRC